MEEDTAIINQEEKTRAISALMYKITGIVQYYPAEQRIYNLIQRQGWPFRVYAGLEINPVHSNLPRIYYNHIFII